MKALNFALLIGGYALGQGAIFLAQTWLISRGNVELVADFGMAFYVATLALLFVDFGSITYLARETAVIEGDEDRIKAIPRLYWTATVIRVIAALAVAIAGALACMQMRPNPFLKSYLEYASPALFFWAFNGTGILDGLKRSGINGAANATPFLISGMALFFVADAAPGTSGSVMGGSLCVGYLLAAAAQLVAIKQSGASMTWAAPTRRELAQSAAMGFSALLTSLPGQLYFRFQLFASNHFLGKSGTGLLIYAKQVIIGFAQIIGFLRRIEFPDLVARLGRRPTRVLLEVAKSQKVGTAIAVASTIAMAFGGAAASLIWTDHLGVAGKAISLFSPVVVTSAVLLSLTQAITAQGQYRLAANMMIASTALAMLLTWGFSSLSPQLASFAAADIVANLVTIGVAAILLRRSAPSEKTN